MWWRNGEVTRAWRQVGKVTLGQVREMAVKMSGNKKRDVRLIDR